MGCSPEPSAPSDPRPSFLLIVLDTVRADAVSALGEVSGTTPAIDALAAEGQLYRRAYSEAPWTIPSHASLFSGSSGLAASPTENVGARRVVLPDEIETLAERLAGAGYETVGLSENPLVSGPFGLTQGFDQYAVRTQEDLIAETHGRPLSEGFTVRHVQAWANEYPAEKPFFLFVNLMDAHEPYAVRSENPFLPDGVDSAQARALRQSTSRICDAIPSAAELATLRGLYLGDVAAADQKVSAIRESLASLGLDENLITIVTSDHGEHLGENRLLDHQFSLHNVLLHVPLVVHGVPGAAPSTVDAPVSLLDVVPSVLAWIGDEPPEELAGSPLPATSPASEDDLPERDLLAFYASEKPVDWPEAVRIYAGEKRTRCGPEDRVFSDIASLTRWPFKFVWYRDHAPLLFDLSWDADERSDLSTQRPDTASALAGELHDRLVGAGIFEAPSPDPALSPEGVERLRSLGYTE